MARSNRRTFLQASAAGLAAAAWPATAQAPTKPNLLLLHCDQLSSWALSCYAGELQRVPNYGATLVQTPHLDRLAAEGARLTNFFVTSAVCTPSRGCFFTGRYPHAHGAWHNDLPLNRDEITIGQALKNAGYRTGYCGKWHLDGDSKPGWMTPDRSMGFDECRHMFNRGHWKEIREAADGTPSVTEYTAMGDARSFTTDYLATKTIDFLRRHRGEPWCWVVSWPDPHTPFTVRAPYDTMYQPADMVVPRTFTPHQDGKKLVDEAELRRRKAAYCGLVKCIDDNVGRVLAALEQTGQLESTIIVFTTDHGEYLGEHDRWGKNQWYRTAHQVPFLIRYPASIPAGTVVPQMIGSVDVVPSLLRLMGQPPTGREQGRDASALLQGRAADWVDEQQLHHSSLAGAGLYTPEWELVLRRDAAPLLFNRLQDPEQISNLAAAPEYQERVAAMSARILAHHQAVESPAAAWLAQPHPTPTAPAADGAGYRADRLELDTTTRPGPATFVRLLTTPAGAFQAGRRYRLRFDYRSGGLRDDDSFFYFTLRPGNDREHQVGPVTWWARAGESGSKEQLLETGPYGNFALILGIFGHGALVVENLVIEPAEVEEDDG